MARYPSAISQHSTLKTQLALRNKNNTHNMCYLVTLHWYTIQRIQSIRLGNTLARGLVSSLDHIVFGPICYNMAHELSYIIVEGRLVDAAAKLTSLQMKRPLLWHMQHMNKGGLASYIRPE